ncbi:hypothetical protein D3C87_1413560 [compost metagenome]
MATLKKVKVKERLAMSLSLILKITLFNAMLFKKKLVPTEVNSFQPLAGKW